MVSLYTHKDANIRKTWLLLTLFVGIVIGVGFIFSQVYQDPGILYVAVLLSILSSFGSYWFSDTIVLSLTGARKVEMADAPELYRIVENLAITAGLPMPRVYIIPEAAPNAFATGRNPEHAVVAVTEGLLARLDRSELEGVLAHELSHVGNRDMLLSTVAAVLVGFIAIASDFFLRSSFWGRRRDDREGGNVFAILGLLLAILAPIAATLMQLAISRKREFLADASGALLTRYPDALASALQKIAGDPTPMDHPSHATAHLWLTNPFKEEGGPSFLTRLFMTHPPIEERIAALKGMDLARK